MGCLQKHLSFQESLTGKICGIFRVPFQNQAVLKEFTGQTVKCSGKKGKGRCFCASACS